MAQRLKGLLAWHTETALHLLRLTPPSVLLIPAAGAVALYVLNAYPAIVPYLDKETAEIISPIILGVAVAMAAWLALTRRHVYDKWQLVFAISLFLRELHFPGTNTGFYIALVVLLVWASHARDRLEPFFSDKRIVVPLMAMLWTYFITKLLDRGYLDGGLPAGTTRDLFEENLEILGHLTFVILVVLSFRVVRAGAASRAADASASPRS